MELIKVLNDYNSTNRMNILKRYRLQKKIRSLIDPAHLVGAYSIIYTIIFK